MATTIPTEFLSLPFEVQDNILDHVLTSSDILHFALTSRQCYDLALPILYRKLNWTIGSTAHGRASLRAKEYVLVRLPLVRAVRALRFSEKKSPPESDHCVPWSWSAAREDPEMPRDDVLELVHADHHVHHVPPWLVNVDLNSESNHLAQLTHIMTETIPAFTNLVELTLRSITLPTNAFYSIHSLAVSLRTLTIRSCLLTSQYPPELDPNALNITDLTLLNLSSGSVTMPRRVEAIMQLVRSPCLRTLRLDRSLEIAFNSLIRQGVPDTLRTLICDFRFLFYRSGRSDGAPLLKFLNACTSVEELAITDLDVATRAPDLVARLQTLEDAFPNLRTITAPLLLIRIFVGRRPLRSITICDTANVNPPLLVKAKVQDIDSNLRGIEDAPVALEHLALNIKEWDKELMYMLSAKVPSLRRLTIVYRQGDVDDDFFMTLGNIIEFPLLERLHLYKYGDRMVNAAEDEFETHKEYMIIWQRYMPDLNEVALSPDVVWVRCSQMRSSWSRRYIQPMEGVKGLLSF